MLIKLLAVRLNPQRVAAKLRGIVPKGAFLHEREAALSGGKIHLMIECGNGNYPCLHVQLGQEVAAINVESLAIELKAVFGTFSLFAERLKFLNVEVNLHFAVPCIGSVLADYPVMACGGIKLVEHGAHSVKQSLQLSTGIAVGGSGALNKRKIMLLGAHVAAIADEICQQKPYLAHSVAAVIYARAIVFHGEAAQHFDIYLLTHLRHLRKNGILLFQSYNIARGIFNTARLNFRKAMSF